MRTLLIALCGVALALVSCIPSNRFPTPDPNAVSTIVVQTAQAASAATAAALAAQPVAPVDSCKDGAALAGDATSTAVMSVPSGLKFTKTWQLNNTGDCNWRGYSFVFVAGDRMDAPDAAPVPDTAARSAVTVSVDLVAPAGVGNFTGYFELRDPTGRPLDIGSEKTVSVKVGVVEVAAPTPVPASNASLISSGAVVIPPPPPDCKYTKSATYPGDIMGLINKARADAGVPALVFNAQLAASAQGHTTDMACNNYFDHAGRNQSTIHDRVASTGYNPSFSEEMIYCSGYPTDAFNWWMGDPAHHDVIVDPRVKEFGVGYAYLARTQCGSYFTVDLAAP